MSTDLPTGVVTFLFSDIEGSTQLWERYPETMRAALARHDELLREVIELCAGRVVKTTGDGCYAVFRHPADAVLAAVDVQLVLLAEPWTMLGEDTLRVRIGLNTGETELRQDDYHGPALNRAARVMSVGHGGQILVSAVTASLLENGLPAGARLEDRGEHLLKGLERPERIYQLFAPGLPGDFPPLRSLSEYVVSLPTPATGFVDRTPEVQTIIDMLADPGVRLLSLVGPGGAGKTRLAIEAAGDIAERGPDRFKDGVYFVPLAPLCTADSMVSAVAQTVGFRFRQSEEPPRTQLLDYLRRKRVLLVMDNLEHLLSEGGAELPAEIIANSPGVGLLVTSRTRLNVQGEHLYPVGGMRIPDLNAVRAWQDLDREAAEYNAIQLFCQAASRVRPGFRLSRSNVVDVARICRLVQGLPLGIELAAAWLDVLSLSDIAAEIERSLDILSTDQAGVPDRQRSIRAVFDTSWSLLSDHERTLLPLLSIFRGRFTREAALFVIGGVGGLRDLSALKNLVNKSWLGLAEDGSYQFHVLLRQYASEKLHDQPEIEAAARDRQARYYARFLESRLRGMQGQEQNRHFDAVGAEFDDIRQAWEWWVQEGEFGRLVDQMLLPIYTYATVRFLGTEIAPLFDEAITRLRRMLEPHPPAPDAAESVALASLLTARASIYLNHFTGEFDRGDIRPAWDIAAALGDEAPVRLGFWYTLLNLFYGFQYDRAAAVANLRRYLPVLDAADDMTRAAARQTLAALLTPEFARPEDARTAIELLNEALAVYEALGNTDSCAATYRDLADAHVVLRRYDDALRYLELARPLAESVGNWGMLWVVLLMEREVYLQSGEPDEMFPIFDEMLAMSRRSGNYRLEVWTLSWDSIYSVRYHSAERALERREMSLALAEEFNLTYDMAWGSWERGDIARMMGDLTAARQWYDRARPLFERIGDMSGLAFYRRGLGDLALARAAAAAAQGDDATAAREYEVAHEHFDYLYTTSHDNHMTWTEVYGLCGLAQVAAGRGDFAAAQPYLREALRLAAASGRNDLTVLPLACLVRVARAAGDTATAAAVSATLLDSPLTWLELREWVRPLAGETAAPVTRAAVAAPPAPEPLGALVERLLGVERWYTVEG